MKRPKEPRNINFWRGVVNDPSKCQEFMDRAGHQARKELIQAIRFVKWQRIQSKKKEKVYA